MRISDWSSDVCSSDLEADRDRPIRWRVVSQKQRGVRQAMDVIIYHNPDCGTSRNTLAMIRNAGVEPHVIEYLKTPPSRDMLTRLIARMGISARELLREKGTPDRKSTRLNSSH